jgi:hypothetical protein
LVERNFPVALILLLPGSLLKALDFPSYLPTIFAGKHMDVTFLVTHNFLSSNKRRVINLQHPYYGLGAKKKFSKTKKD